METKQNSDDIGYYDNLIVIFYTDEERNIVASFELWQQFEYGITYTFGDILEQAKKEGYKDGIITLLAESFLNGKIYRYGNYLNDEKWHEVGTLKGFA